jgi:hypothetical protein
MGVMRRENLATQAARGPTIGGRWQRRICGGEDSDSAALQPSMEAEPAWGSNGEHQAWWRRHEAGNRLVAHAPTAQKMEEGWGLEVL